MEMMVKDGWCQQVYSIIAWYHRDRSIHIVESDCQPHGAKTTWHGLLHKRLTSADKAQLSWANKNYFWFVNDLAYLVLILNYILHSAGCASKLSVKTAISTLEFNWIFSTHRQRILNRDVWGSGDFYQRSPQENRKNKEFFPFRPKNNTSCAILSK